MGLVLGLMFGVAMPEKDAWITYERFGRGMEKHYATVPATEKRPVGYSSERPATKPEIAAEKKRRAKQKQYADRRQKFAARPEYQDAQMIASTLELMDVDTNPLDVFTPEEWRKLRERICGRSHGDEEGS